MIRVGIAIVVLVAAFVLGCSGLRQPAHEERDQPVAEENLRILQRAGELLPDEAHWNRQDTRECPAGESALSLFCALQKASIEVMGEPALGRKEVYTRQRPHISSATQPRKEIQE